MTPRLKLGPGDHNRQLTLDDFESAEYEEGYQYELIDGKLYYAGKKETQPRITRITRIGKIKTRSNARHRGCHGASSYPCYPCNPWFSFLPA